MPKELIEGVLNFHDDKKEKRESHECNYRESFSVPGGGDGTVSISGYGPDPDAALESWREIAAVIEAKIASLCGQTVEG